MSRIVFRVRADSCKLHGQRRQCLSRAIVQFACYMLPLYVLRLQELPRKVTQFRVSSFKFPSTELHLGIECIRQCSITLFTLTQRPLNLFPLADVPSNFRRSHNLSAGIPDGRNCERNIKRSLVFTDTNRVEVFDSSALLDS